MFLLGVVVGVIVGVVCHKQLKFVADAANSVVSFFKGDKK